MDFNIYNLFKNATLSELNWDANGMLFNIYNVTGPCICTSYSWIKADVIFFPAYMHIDVNFDWNNKVFYMYVSDKQTKDIKIGMKVIQVLEK